MDRSIIRVDEEVRKNFELVKDSQKQLAFSRAC